MLFIIWSWLLLDAPVNECSCGDPPTVHFGNISCMSQGNVLPAYGSEISIIIEWSRFFGFFVEFFNINNGSALQAKLILLVIQLDQ
jgi:hypothetical protein